jgi:hypothetical protein
MSRLVLAAVAFVALLSPSLAAEFYVAKNTETGKCVVGEQKPDGTKYVMIGTTTYPTKEEAKAAKKASPDCKKNPAN